MAKRHLLILIGALMFAGCSSQSMVSTLPSPNFNAPQVAQQPQPLRLPAAPMPAPAAKPVRPPTAIAGIPPEWVVSPSAPKRPWRWIVIHHSATPTGGAAAFDRMHKEKGWDELGYHFVVGNGTDTGDGQVEVGPRWPKQKWGAHAKTPDNRFNDYGIGICLVGNFDIEHPSQPQMRSVAKLVAYMMRTYHISPDRVLGHGDTKATDCPGRNTNLAEIRRMATQMVAEADGIKEEDVQTAYADGSEVAPALIDDSTK